ncbi:MULTISPECIES: iron-containing alcohol dehydrogenase family protein [Kosmotoga]|uniref:Iron-containing alcohol dehydrogenase n=1 Tax=Kosmotoga olearia (strain ATCC BAA-1733 / DSM 21960 / TBF 19.5.1) TaxID=521045 RepID=C5CEN4_KOSOT|nr:MULTISPECIES: iron-containing alcohol dehydrogenase family protein [Kosmotoga]ACR80214.1 iron-containing alcohol dehydrogenase [Kosmotoga olearia TBF 19.5.1]MDI3523502.1 alcohol dehydrogenase [Kosmotoga sp.]OAA20154.1 alcohol dehydrogenase [Kosmotoga sp. DU53]
MWHYYLPTHVFFGETVVEKHGKVVQECGAKALIVTGRRSARLSGALHDIIKVLTELKIPYIHFDRVEENPSFETVRKGTELLRKENCDFVIAIGGGSPLDAGKAMAIMGTDPDLKVEDLYDRESYLFSLPVVAIPTTSGTGSEVTQYSVLTDDEGNKKGFATPHAFPMYSFLDPRYTITMTEETTIATALDALSHSIEGELLNNAVNPIVKNHSRVTNELIKNNLKNATITPEDIPVRSLLQYAAMLAGIVIAHTGTTVVHAAGYPLSSKRGIKHGIANAVFLVEVLRKVEESDPDRVKNAIDPFESLNELEAFLNSFGVNEYKIELSDDELESWAEKAARAPHNARTPGEFDVEFYRNLYKKVRKCQNTE